MQSGLSRQSTSWEVHWEQSSGTHKHCTWHTTGITTRLCPSTTPGKLASSGQEDPGSSHLSIMSWTDITELISPGSNCWQLPVTNEDQRFPCERVISLGIPNSVWPHPVWDKGSTLPFPQVALQKQLARNDSTVILIYNHWELYDL